MENDKMRGVVDSYLEESLRCMEKTVENSDICEKIVKGASICIDSIDSGGKIIFMGNGGSAADSQHLATELVSRYKSERKAISAISLTVDSSTITAIGNDYSFEEIFSRQIQANAREGDVVIGISTSGSSMNVIYGLREAQKKGCKTISLTGWKGGKVSEFSDLTICAPSDNTPVIQQAHITYGHAICDLVERSTV